MLTVFNFSRQVQSYGCVMWVLGALGLAGGGGGAAQFWRPLWRPRRRP